MKYNSFEIKQGVKLHLINTNKFKTSLVGIFLTNPIKKESVTKTALFSSVLKMGTNNIKTQKAINIALEEMYGAECSIGIQKLGDNETIKAYVETVNDMFLPNDENILQKSIEMLFEVIFNPLVENGTFKKEYVDMEKNTIKSLIEARINNKDQYALEKCIEAMYKDKSYSLYKYGDVKDLENIDEKNLYTFYLDYINSAKIDIFVSGDLDEENIKNIISDNIYIKNLKERKNNLIQNGEEFEKKEKINEVKNITEKLDVVQGKLVIGLNIIDMKKDEKYVALMLNTILGDGASSKLFQNVREKAHLAYNTRSTYEKTKNDIYIRCGIEIDKYEKALEIAKKQILDIQNGDFTDKDMENARKYIFSAIDSLEEEQEEQVSFYFSNEIMNANISEKEYKEKISKVSKDEIINLSKRLNINTIYFLRN